MRLSAAATVGILLVLALISSGCGEDGTSAAGKPVGTVSTPSTATPKKARPVRACHQLRGFVRSMVGLRDKLARGLSYDDYLREVQGVRSHYSEIEAGKLTLGCLLASGGPAERALNLYLDATNIWGDCLATVSCNTRSIEPELQRKWALAAHQLSVARRAM